MNVYFISGLGADRRAFQKIQLDEVYRIHHIDWIEPLRRESLSDYTNRLSKAIDSSRPFILIGLSFGGVIAIELAKHIKPEKIIIISSLSTSNELPKKFRIISVLNLHRVIPAYAYKKPPRIVSYFFSANTNTDRKLLYQIFEDSSASFLKWAVDRLLKWRNAVRPENLFHIHGAADRLIPAGSVKADITIPGAGHLMVLTHASTVSNIIERQLKQ